jgi:hypothetical protein
VPLVRALRRRGAFTRLGAAIGVSPALGAGRLALAGAGNRLLALAYLAGVQPRRLARRYQPLGPTELAELAEPDPEP